MPPNQVVVTDVMLTRMPEAEIYQLHNLFPHQLWDYGKLSYTLSNCGSNCTYSHGGKDEALLNYVRQRRPIGSRQYGKTAAAQYSVAGVTFQPEA